MRIIQRPGINLAGGEAFSLEPEMELTLNVLTSFVKESFYLSEREGLKKTRDVISRADPTFLPKLALYARHKIGMRTISHVLAAELATKRFNGKKDFYRDIVKRPDDMFEIIAYYKRFCKKAGGGKKLFLNNSLKRGFAEAFSKFDGYQLAKYRGEGKEIKLVDLVNLLHPKAVGRNADALAKLVKGELKSTETWEAKLSKTGQDAGNEEDLKSLKKSAWMDLLSNKKIGYFALLRNLRNIITQAPEAIPLACEMLTDERLIESSLVMPFRFSTAYDELTKIYPSGSQPIIQALHDATSKSCKNVPRFTGKTVVAVDISGSMRGQPSDIASLFGAILTKSNNADLIKFGTKATYVSYNQFDTIYTIRDYLKYGNHNTDFKPVFRLLDKKYDRIIILSDMQGWVDRESPKRVFEMYCEKFECKPFVYSWDLKGYGTTQLPEDQIFLLAGFSDKVFDVMRLLETDKNALYNEIINY